MIRKTGIISALLIANQAAYATDCVIPAKFNAKNRDALIICQQTEINELKGIPASSELTQTIGDFMVATVRQATQDKMTSNDNSLNTTAVFTLKNISTEPLYIAAQAFGFNISDDQGGAANIRDPLGWNGISQSQISTPANQTIIPPKTSVTVALSYSGLNHSAYTQPTTMSFGGNFFKLNADGTVETFGVQFNGVKIKHP